METLDRRSSRKGFNNSTRKAGRNYRGDNKRCGNFNHRQPVFSENKEINTATNLELQRFGDNISNESERVGRTYATIIKPNEKIDDVTYTKNDTLARNFNYEQYFLFTPKRISVRNQNPRNRSSGFCDWEQSYFTHLMNLKKIFLNGTKSILSTRLNLNSSEFDTLFFRFIRQNSSGEISKYL